MRWMKHLAAIFPVMVLLTGLTGCSAPSEIYLDPEADIEFYERVAVVPFFGGSGERGASDLVTDAFITALMVSEKYLVVEPGHFRHMYGEEVGGKAVPVRGLTPEMVKTLGLRAGVEAIFEGTILAYQQSRSGQSQFPMITLEVRMIDVQTGRLVWMTTINRTGGPNVPFFGFGETHTLPELALEITRELVERVP